MTEPSGAASRWAGRRQARTAALQMLYQCEVGGLDMAQALSVLDKAGTPETAVLGERDRDFASSLASGVMADAAAIDERLAQATRHWRVERMATLDRIVLRLAVHEWLAHPETPPRVVINEAIELARSFSGEEAARFVNGVLDGVFRALRDEGRVQGE